MDKLDQYIERVQHLPPASPVVALLPGVLSDPNRDSDRLAELIRHDPSLTAELLKRCNSAFFRGAEPATDVFEAVSRLGFREVEGVVSTVSGRHTTPATRVEDHSVTDGLWRHSVMTAVAASTLAIRVGSTESQAFTVGLLHDVGKLVFASLEGPAYKALMEKAGVVSGLALAHVEEAALGANHADVGARLLSRWGLPTSITLCVQHHHRSLAAAAPYERLSAIVHLANNLAHYLMGGDATAPELAAHGEQAVALLQLPVPDLYTVMEQTQERLARVQEALKITW
jgi:putative nucleotidyltransferase with HDIG domain